MWDVLVEKDDTNGVLWYFTPLDGISEVQQFEVWSFSKFVT